MSAFKKVISLAVLAVITIFYVPLAFSECIRNPAVYNFGDSNSDTGGGAVVTGFVFTRYPEGSVFFHEATGRPCDGRLVIDFLSENVSTKYLTPYLESVGPDFGNGANFAISGAATLPLHGSYTLGIQVLQFVHFRNRSIHLRNKGYQNLSVDEDFGNALYSIDIGQNDLAAAFDSLPYDQVISKIPRFIAEIWNAMWVIYNLGGRNFWVHNTGPLGCLPYKLSARKANASSSELDPYGCISSLNEGAKIFNSNLNILCQQLRLQMKNATIVYVDIYSIKYNLIANSSQYGFKNPLTACRGSNDTVCKEAAISWDGVHYTEAANSIVASKILSTNYSTPPLPFNFFCNINTT